MATHNASSMNHADSLTTAIHDWAVGRGTHHEVMVRAAAAGLCSDAKKDLDRITAYAALDINNARSHVVSVIGRYL